MTLLLKISRILVLSVWMLIIWAYTFCLHFGGWQAIKRISLCASLWARGIIRIINLKIKVHGDLAAMEQGLIVSNHMGYLDILVHASLFPIRFASKIQVRKWPLLGWYLSVSRSIWVDRSSKQKSKQTLGEFKDTMFHGISLLVYPEGTSSSGEQGMLPFKSTPFESVIGTELPILPIITRYKLPEDGKPLAWYGNDMLLPNIWRILGYRKMEVEVYILPPIHAGTRSRKELAQDIHKIMEREYHKVVEAERNASKQTAPAAKKTKFNRQKIMTI